MDEQLHIIIAGEQGGSKSIPFTKKKLYIISGITCAILTILVTGCFFTTKNSAQNFLMQNKITSLEKKLEKSTQTCTTLRKEIVSIKKKNRNQIDDLQVRHDLERTTLQLENVKLMSTAVSELNERSELIESIMSSVGVKIKKQKAKDNSNSGGPYLPQAEASYDALIDKADNYLETIKALPLGNPSGGSISSRYGKRIDPFNGKRGFHTGVDIRGKKGDKIFATASGRVVKAEYNSGYGNVVQISHGNGYATTYAHMQNYVVKKGDRIEQGQLIGQIGSTGRSTGPHLHYEISLNKKTINPAKFMKIAELSHTFKTTTVK